MTRQRAPATVVLVGLALVGLPDPATAQGAAGARAPIAAEPEGYALRHETDQIVLLAREDEPNASRLPETATQLGEYATGTVLRESRMWTGPGGSSSTGIEKALPTIW
jgi:hypothetical protein